MREVVGTGEVGQGAVVVHPVDAAGGLVALAVGEVADDLAGVDAAVVVALPEDCAAVGRGGDVQAFVGGIGTLGAEEGGEVAVERRAVVVAGLAVDALHEVEVALDERVFLHGATVVEGGVCAHPGLLFLLTVLQALVGGELQADVLVHGEPLAGCEVVAAVDLVVAAAALLVVDGHPLVLVVEVEVGMPAPLAAAVVVGVVGGASAPA